MMHKEETPLDLNNIPEVSTRDNGMNRKRKREGKDDWSEKVYECRFCSLKFCKYQALGGHMNRHRKEIQNESLNRARMLVYNNDNVIIQGPSHLGSQPIPPGTFHQASNIGDPTPPFQHQVYTQPFFFSTTMLSPPAAGVPQPPVHCETPAAYIYEPHPNANDYIVGGHDLPAGATSQNYVPGPWDTYFTFLGAPVGSQHSSQ